MISNDDDGNNDNNFFSLLPIEIIYQIVKSLADLPAYHLLSSPLTRNVMVAPYPASISVSRVYPFNRKIYDLFILQPVESLESPFDILHVSLINTRKANDQLTLYLLQLPDGKFSLNINEHG